MNELKKRMKHNTFILNQISDCKYFSKYCNGKIK